jgi:predicted DCC family thiol-disulfide oxidoreductase YuxK
MVTAPNTVSPGASHSDPAVRAADRIFYDGVCGLCQGYIRFLVKRDRAGDKFRYAPLQGTTFEALVPPDRRRSLPDSLVVLTNDGRLLVRSDGVIHILRRLGGFWGVVAGAISVIPRPIRDAVYNFVARIRYRVFGKRKNVCPVTPPDLRARFDD